MVWVRADHKNILCEVWKAEEVGSPYAVKVGGHKMSLKFADVASDTPACLVGMIGGVTGYAAETGIGKQ